MTNNISFKCILRIVFFSLLIATLISCSASNNSGTKPEQDQDSSYVYHRVKYSGETYKIISTWYTKSAQNSSLLIELNPKIKPTKIKIGDLIKIPKELLARPKSLPKDFVDSYSTPKVAKTPEPAIQQPAAEVASDMPVDNSYTKAESPKVEPHENTKTKVEETVSDTVDSKTAASDFSENNVEVKNAPAESNAPAAEDPNAKIREKLMQELLQ